jgi:5'-deoxynucleotidase YfbR-like HD superfamily hydrolase
MIDPCNPEPADICIEDIAHALPQICRFTGHASVFYSVAQHSLWVSEWLANRGASPLLQLAGLLHDASEAYLSDLNTPAKRQLRDYLAAEERVQGAIAEAFGLPFEILKCRTVKDADKAAYEWEKPRYLLPDVTGAMSASIPLVRAEFHDRFWHLKGAL